MATPSVKVFSFTSQTTTGAQVVSVSFGFTPKAFIFYSAGSGYFPFEFSQGLDDLTNRVGRSVSSGYFIGSNSPSSTWSSSGYSLISNRALAVNQVLCLGYVSSCDTTSVTIQWDAMGLDPRAMTWIGVAVGGANTNVKVGTVTWSVSGSFSTTAVGFQPEGLIGWLNNGVTTATSLTTASGPFGHTYAASESCGGAYAFYGDNGSFETPTNTKSRQEAGQFWLDTSGNSGTLTSFDANGFTLNNSAGISGSYFAYLAVNGCAINTGTFTQPTTTGNQVVSIIAATPRLLLIGGTDKVSATGNTNDFLYSIGAATLTDQRSIWSGNLDNKTANGFASLSYEAGYIVNAQTPTGYYTSTQSARSSLSSWTNGQFVLNWDVVDSTQRQFFYFIIADSTSAACGAAASGTITVTKNTTPISGGGTTFDFTTSGGLSPSTFQLQDGESQVFSSLSAGTYGVTEIGLPGWTSAYSVSNSDPHDAIVISGNAVTVTVTNTLGTTNATFRKYRRWALPYDGNKRIFIPRIEIIAQMGVGNSDDPDPVMYMRISPDGGQTWGPRRQMPLGAAGETMVRAYLTRFCQGLRNPVAELWCDDDVFVAWVECVLPQDYSVGTS